LERAVFRCRNPRSNWTVRAIKSSKAQRQEEIGVRIGASTNAWGMPETCAQDLDREGAAAASPASQKSVWLVFDQITYASFSD
jgi:hypothetical protein